MGETDSDRIWMIHDNGRQLGPHTLIEMAMLYAGGSISGSAVAWQSGWAQWVPILQVIPQSSTPVRVTMPDYHAPASIKIPLLISAIGNIVVALLWLTTCFGFIFAVPMIVLCVFEFRLYAVADELPLDELTRRSKTLAIYEIIVGLANLVSLVCGILLMIHAPNVQRKDVRR